jgi:hypothetical protein
VASAPFDFEGFSNTNKLNSAYPKVVLATLGLYGMV